jgi:hypothetical protein
VVLSRIWLMVMKLTNQCRSPLSLTAAALSTRPRPTPASLICRTDSPEESTTSMKPS